MDAGMVIITNLRIAMSGSDIIGNLSMLNKTNATTIPAMRYALAMRNKKIASPILAIF